MKLSLPFTLALLDVVFDQPVFPDCGFTELASVINLLVESETVLVFGDNRSVNGADKSANLNAVVGVDVVESSHGLLKSTASDE